MNPIAGHCGKCGAPYTTPTIWHGITPPPMAPSCMCWNTPQTYTSTSVTIETSPQVSSSEPKKNQCYPDEFIKKMGVKDETDLTPQCEEFLPIKPIFKEFWNGHYPDGRPKGGQIWENKAECDEWYKHHKLTQPEQEEHNKRCTECMKKVDQKSPEDGVIWLCPICEAQCYKNMKWHHTHSGKTCPVKLIPYVPQTKLNLAITALEEIENLPFKQTYPNTARDMRIIANKALKKIRGE